MAYADWMVTIHFRQDPVLDSGGGALSRKDERIEITSLDVAYAPLLPHPDWRHVGVRFSGFRMILRATMYAFLMGALASYGPISAAQPATVALSESLRTRVEAGQAAGRITADGHAIRAFRAVPLFYEARGFSPVWMAGERPGPAYRELREALALAQEHGLDPANYHIEVLDQLARSLETASSRRAAAVDFELLASDAYLVLGSHLLSGRVNPVSIDPEWLANRRTSRMDTVLTRAVEAQRIRESLLALTPRQPRYGTLLAAFDRLRELDRSGGWPTVPAGGKMETGVSGPRVTALRARLQASGDLDRETGSDTEMFDEPLAAAVRRFQVRHGLDDDGIVGPATLAALNVPTSERVRQLSVNLERWRWLPDELGERHIEVNIAGFDVKVVEQGRTVRRHRAIVGREYRQTPVFSSTMTYLVLSPYWHVPPGIAAVDKLPQLKADPLSLVSQGYALIDQSTNSTIEFGSLDWASVTGSDFNRRYRLRQDPGPLNALGAVKFMFPNPHNVYLHDTPSRELFERSSRAFSSGCIRIDSPLDLAEYLLADQSEWNRARIDAVATAGSERTVWLSQGVPVHVLYWTAWADADGVIHFRDDLYGRDRTVWDAINSQPPGV